MPTRRRHQPTYHCPACEKQLPHHVAWPLVAEIEATGGTVPYLTPCCGRVVEHVLILWDRK